MSGNGMTPGQMKILDYVRNEEMNKSEAVPEKIPEPVLPPREERTAVEEPASSKLTNSQAAASALTPEEVRSAGDPSAHLARHGEPAERRRARGIRLNGAVHLGGRTVHREVRLRVEGAVTQRTILDALEARYPMLRGTIRDHATQRRRPFVRFFACQEDLSHEAPDTPLPDAVARGDEPFLIIGAMAGG